MGSYLFEVKTMLRSILISSPVIINVFQLDKDFREQEGIGIPFGKFGYNSLLEFLNSIPDVLIVNGSSKFSDVTLVASEKSSHVNELVMKQKPSSKPGSFSSNKTRSMRRKPNVYSIKKSPTEEKIQHTSHSNSNARQDDGYSTQKTSSLQSYKGGKCSSPAKLISVQNTPECSYVNYVSPNQSSNEAAPVNVKTNRSEEKHVFQNTPTSTSVKYSPQQQSTNKATSCSSNETPTRSYDRNLFKNTPKSTGMKYPSPQQSTNQTVPGQSYEKSTRSDNKKLFHNNSKPTGMKYSSSQQSTNGTYLLQKNANTPEIKHSFYRRSVYSGESKERLNTYKNENVTKTYNRNSLNRDSVRRNPSFAKTMSSRNDSSIEVSSLNSSSFLEVDVSLRLTKKPEDLNYWRGGITSKSKRGHYSQKELKEKEKSLQRNEIVRNKVLNWNTSCNDPYFSPNTINKVVKAQSSANMSHNKIHRKLSNYIPKKVQSNLQKLISDFPDGILCEELPVAYKKLIGEELCFENYGYRYLIYLCLDLNSIFHCVKESSSDYRLYDAKKPLPELNTTTDYFIEETVEEHISPEPTLAIPDLIWGSFDSFLPEDVIKLEFELKRVQVADVLSTGSTISVTVADIYDISKFWIIVDDCKLQYLMDTMQRFYELNRQRYLVPKSLLEEGLHCVVLFRGKFHRAVILNAMYGEDYLKVYYFDYGTLGMVSKSEVWFLTKLFSELPRQAIRSRLSDIYPPYSGVTWSQSANSEFSRMTCMKKHVAEIVRIDTNKNLVDVKLRYGDSYISDILVDLKYAIFISQTPKKHIEDSNCNSKVQFIHLFPTFDEIENWVVPSIDEAANFLETTVTADFLYSQYFSRTSHKELIESIEEKTAAILKKKKAFTKYLKEPERLKGMEEMNKIAYGLLYEDLKKDDDAGKHSIPESSVHEGQNNSRIIDIKDDETLIGILRQTRMKNANSHGQEKALNLIESVLDPKDSYISASQSRDLAVNHKSPVNNSMEDNFPWQRPYDTILQDSFNLKELEKYLSEDSSKDASKKSFPNLIDLDLEFTSPKMSSTNLLMYSEFETSQMTLERSKTSLRCLLTDPNEEELRQSENVLDLPIPDNTCMKPQTDLIQFDVELSSNELTSSEAPRDVQQPKKIIFEIGGSEYGDADDEDSDERINSLESSSEKNHMKLNSHNIHNSDPAFGIQRQSSLDISNQTLVDNLYDLDAEFGCSDLTDHEDFSPETDSQKLVVTHIENSKNFLNEPTEISKDDFCNDGIPECDFETNDFSIIKTDANSASTTEIKNPTERKYVSSRNDSHKSRDSSIVTIDSVELKNESDMDIASTCSSIVNITDLSSYKCASTPFPLKYTHGVKSFYEEFEMINSPTLCPSSDITSEAAPSKLTSVCSEFDVKSKNILCDVFQNSNSANQEVGCGNITTSDIDILKTSNNIGEACDLNMVELKANTCDNTKQNYQPNAPLNALPFVPPHTNVQYGGPQTVRHPPQRVVRPPPGFFAIPPPRVLYPFVNQYGYYNPYVPSLTNQNFTIQQHEIVYEGSQNCNNPIVVINYNFLPMLNPNSRTDE